MRKNVAISYLIYAPAFPHKIHNVDRCETLKGLIIRLSLSVRNTGRKPRFHMAICLCFVHNSVKDTLKEMMNILRI